MEITHKALPMTILTAEALIGKKQLIVEFQVLLEVLLVMVLETMLNIELI